MEAASFAFNKGNPPSDEPCVVTASMESRLPEAAGGYKQDIVASVECERAKERANCSRYIASTLLISRSCRPSKPNLTTLTVRKQTAWSGLACREAQG